MIDSPDTSAPSQKGGTIVAIRGGVVDVAFSGTVPRIHARVQAGELVMEVSLIVRAGPDGAVGLHRHG